jgi:hypothetical protein
MCGCASSSSPALPLLILLFIDLSRAPSTSLQSLGATLLGGLTTLQTSLLVIDIALFDGDFVIAILTLVSLDAFRLSKYLSQIDITWAYTVTKSAFDTGLQPKFGCCRPSCALGELK